jgi:hypothetical protein
MLAVSEGKGKGQDQKPLEPIRRAIFGRFGILVSIVMLLSFTLVCTIGSVSKGISGAEAPSTATQAPVTLLDEVEHLPAPSWKAIPVSLSNNGIVSIDIRVLRGNPIDVFLMPPDQLEKVKKSEWNNLKTSGDIRAIKTPSYQHTGRLAKGEYYLVLSDMSVALPSSTPSDISAKVRLESVAP